MDDQNLLDLLKSYWDEALSLKLDYVQKCDDDYCDCWDEDEQEEYELTGGECDSADLAAEYKGRKVTLNKPFRTSGGPKKFAVYTKNESGKVVLVRFGQSGAVIKKNNPERRKNFRARHNCDNPGPKWKPRYWACWAW